MVMEKVQEIKQAEKKADAIIRDAEEKAGDIASSLEVEVNNLKDAKEKHLALEIKKYREAWDKKAEERITLLQQEYLRKSAVIREKSERKVIDVTDSVWKELKELLSIP